jgi:hypothetical protein
VSRMSDYDVWLSSQPEGVEPVCGCRHEKEAHEIQPDISYCTVEGCYCEEYNELEYPTEEYDDYQD